VKKLIIYLIFNRKIRLVTFFLREEEKRSSFERGFQRFDWILGSDIGFSKPGVRGIFVPEIQIFEHTN